MAEITVREDNSNAKFTIKDNQPIIKHTTAFAEILNQKVKKRALSLNDALAKNH